MKKTIYTEYKKNILLFGFLCLTFLQFSPKPTEASLVDTLVGDSKNCNYVKEGLYLPFAFSGGGTNKGQDFPIFGKLVGDKGCVKVAVGVQDMFTTGFQFFLALVTMIAIYQVSVAGIKWMMTEKDVGVKRNAKQLLQNSLAGLVLALVGWAILTAVNPSLANLNLNLAGLQSKLGNSVRSISNITPIAESGGGVAGEAGNSGGGNTFGTKDPTGATVAPVATIFGYRDGNGITGSAGDNGLGGKSDKGDWRYYTGGAHGGKFTEGVALPLDQVKRELGDKYETGGYEVFKNGKSLGVYPVVDTSQKNFDLSYGFVKQVLKENVTSSDSWSSKDFSYKPIKDYWLTNQKPANPMVRGVPGDSPSAADVDSYVAKGAEYFKIQ